MKDKFRVKNKESGLEYNAWKSAEGWPGYWFTLYDGLVPSKEVPFLEEDKFWTVFEVV